MDYKAFQDELEKIAIKRQLWGLSQKLFPSLRRAGGVAEEAATIGTRYGEEAGRLARQGKIPRWSGTPRANTELLAPEAAGADISARFTEAVGGGSKPAQWLAAKLGPRPQSLGRRAQSAAWGAQGAPEAAGRAEFEAGRSAQRAAKAQAAARAEARAAEAAAAERSRNLGARLRGTEAAYRTRGPTDPFRKVSPASW